MISEDNFTKGSAALLQQHSLHMHEFMRKMQVTNVIDWDELTVMLTTTKSLLGFAASELERVSKNRDNVFRLQDHAARFRMSRGA